jgi:hypothetical protein
VPAYARHETFHPRYGWLKKAVDAAGAPGDVFNDPNAVVTMGVGKNMVKSIRHWGLAFKVLEASPLPGSRRPTVRTSAIGRLWFNSEGGVDPYIEHPGTDWLMHWYLLAPLSQVPVWWIAFNEFPAVEFNEEQLVQFVTDRVAAFGRPNPSSVKKDVSTLLRMYSSGHSVRATYEEQIDAPFRALRLIQPSVHEQDMYRFNVGHKPGLPAHIFTAAVLDFAARTDSGARVVSLSRAFTEIGAPGRAFKLTDDEALELVRTCANETDRFRLTTSAGLPQISLPADPATVAHGLLDEHYAKYGRKLMPNPDPEVAA